LTTDEFVATVQRVQSINPANGEVLATYKEHSQEEVLALVNRAVAAQRAWRETTFAERAEVLRRAAASLRRDKENHAALMAHEMGKPLDQGRAEVEKCALCCDYFAEHAEKFLSPEEIKTELTRSYVLFQPVGVLIANMPGHLP
jgi:succinate-semialdehyde dehydrogenase/glutarate-semialdehyde dehydrogenase